VTAASPLKRVADIRLSNVDKLSSEGQTPVRLCNYTDVYYREEIRSDQDFMAATATAEQIAAFRLQPGDIVITKDSEIADDIAVPAFVAESADDLVCGYHLAIVRPNKDRVDPRFLYWAMSSKGVRDQFSVAATGVTRFGLRTIDMGNVRVALPPPDRQRAVAAFLDAETARISALLGRKRELLELLDERIDCRVLSLVGASPLARGAELGEVPLRRVLRKLDRWTVGGDIVTAFRDGEVTTRRARAREGFTNAWTDHARVQHVEVGDVVIHGLDGFAGAIGDAQLPGVCSPVYHVCDAGDGDGAFYGRMLRLLALGGYLGNFATSTRERAVDFRNWDMFGRIPVPRVPVDEQRSIGDAIRGARPLREKVLLSEARAREHRQALITAAVTGQLDVTKAVA
jgi:type I restriction enzyme S subunit